MVLTDLDIEILKEFCKLKGGELTTTWKIMKKLFKEGKDLENMLIKNRIKRMAEFGLFKIEGKPKTYTLDSDKVFYKMFSFPNRRKKGIAVLRNGAWEIFEV
ncbi:hypothetical protein ES703_31238 [subsurface metagenome]